MRDFQFTFSGLSKSVLLRLKFNEKLLLLFFIFLIPASVYYQSYVIFGALLIIGSVTMYFCLRTKKYFIRSAKLTKEGSVTFQILKWNSVYIKDSFQLDQFDISAEVNPKTRFPEMMLRLKINKEELLLYPDAFFKERHIVELDRRINGESNDVLEETD